MCETKANLVSQSIMLLIAAGCCLYQVLKEKKMGHHSERKIQSPCEQEREDSCLIGEYYYLAVENVVGCNFSWW